MVLIMNKTYNLHSLIDALQQASPTVDYVSECFNRSRISSEDIAPYRHFDSSGYTRNLIFDNADFELMLICWHPGHKTPIHDHNHSTGFIYAVEGTLLEKIYTTGPDRKHNHQSDAISIAPPANQTTYSTSPSNSPVFEASSRLIHTGHFTIISDDIGYHSVENHTYHDCCSLHLYYKPILFCHGYNTQNAQRTHRKLSFHSSYGKRQSSS